MFISYCRADRSIVDGFVLGLRKAYRYHTVWYDDDILGGQLWWKRILKEIGECDLFIFLLSNDALASEHCRNELREALALNKAILPVIIRSDTAIDDSVTTDLREALRETQWEDLSGLENLSDNFTEFRACASLFGAIDELLRPFILGSASKSELDAINKGDTETALRPSPQHWKQHETGHLYWLASDLTLAIPISRESDPEVVRHYVRQTFWHASQLDLGEPIVERFSNLCEKTSKLHSRIGMNQTVARKLQPSLGRCFTL
jgi:hypothetical protein